MISTKTFQIDGVDYGPYTFDDEAGGTVYFSGIKLGLPRTRKPSYTDIQNVTIGTSAYGAGEIWAPSPTDGVIVPPFDADEQTGTTSAAGDSTLGQWSFAHTNATSVNQHCDGFAFPGGVDSGILLVDYLDLYIQFDVKFPDGLDGAGTIQWCFAQVLVGGTGVGVGAPLGVVTEWNIQQTLSAGIEYRSWNLYGAPDNIPGAGTGGYIPTDADYPDEGEWHTMGLHLVLEKSISPSAVWIPSAVMPNNDGWFIEHLDHNFDVTQRYRPENLHFTKKINEIEDADWEVSNSALDVSNQEIIYRSEFQDDAFRPWEHNFRIQRVESGVETTIMGGPITKTNLARGRDFAKVTGRDWMQYLDRRQLPFNPQAPNSFLFGPIDPPPQSLSYQAFARDVVEITQDILAQIMARSYSLPITMTQTAIGLTTNLQLSLGATEMFYSIIQGLSEVEPGFDFRVTFGRDIVFWSPYRFGDPDSTVDDGEFGGNIIWQFDNAVNPAGFDYSLEYGNSGPKQTHLLGTGAGMASSRVGRALGASDAQSQWWRLDGDVDFGDNAKNQDQVNARTRKEFLLGVQAQHDIEIELDPQLITDFWNVFKPGLAVWIVEDLQLHRINSPQQILTMDCTVTNDQDELVKLGVSQIYHATTNYGVEQG